MSQTSSKFFRTPFYLYACDRIEKEHPDWAKFRVENDDFLETTYVVPSPANPSNVLYVGVRSDEIMVKFAAQGSHEHYDLRSDSEDNEDAFAETYGWAFDEYVNPVLRNECYVVRYSNRTREALVYNIERFRANYGHLGIDSIETWS